MTALLALAALLLLDAAAAASTSPLLAIAGAWAALIVLLLTGINAYRSRVESTVTETHIATIQRHRVIRIRKEKPHVPR